MTRWPLVAAPLAGVRAGPAVAVVGLVVAAALLAPLAGYPVGADVDPAAASAWPSAQHPLGADHLGRDVAMRALLATRAFVGPGAAAVALALGAGVPLGAAAGWDRSPLRAAARLVVDAAAAVPAVVLVLLLAAVRGPGASTWALGAGVAFAPGVAALVRDRLERLVVEQHVDAARAHGFPGWYVLWVHGVWVGCGRALARRAVELLGACAALEATLSYLGLGTAEPWPSWGNMLAFEWGHPLGPATWVPAAALWAVVATTARAGRSLAEAPR